MDSNDHVGEVSPEIVESYKDYEPPPWFRKTVEKLLQSVPPTYLQGLRTVVLTNQFGLSRDQRRQKIWRRNRKYRLAELRGAYYPGTSSKPASVWLLVDNILKAEPSFCYRLPVLRYDTVASILYHEIGHHIHTVHRPVYEGKENVADDWSRKLSRRFLRRRYWYLLAFFYPAHLFLKLNKRIKKSPKRV